MVEKYINELDLVKINHYLKHYSHTDSMDAAKYLTHWEEGKGKHLLPMFNNELIISKEIEIYDDWGSYLDSIYDLVYKYNAELFHPMEYICQKMMSRNDPYYRALFYNGWCGFWDKTNIVPKAETTVVTEKGEIKLNLHEGMKPAKAFRDFIKKAAKWLEFTDDRFPYRRDFIIDKDNMSQLEISLDNFLTEYSKFTNQQKIKGELCLSIHPLDYMTMSDNESDWSSCMAWGVDGDEPGCYHAGTVEMMNSSCVVVAYIKSKHDMSIGGNYTWNNKKWRQLFIVDKRFICGVKAYPYQNPDLEAAVIQFLAEKAEPHFGVNYSKSYSRVVNGKIADKVSISPAYFMYNDFGSHTPTIAHSDFTDYSDLNDICDSTYVDSRNVTHIHYGKQGYCTVCGEPFDSETMTVCRGCDDDHEYCSECGCRLYDGDYADHPEDGSPICYDCYNNFYVHCSNCDQGYNRNDEKVYEFVEAYIPVVGTIEEEEARIEEIKNRLEDKMEKALAEQHKYTTSCWSCDLNREINADRYQYSYYVVANICKDCLEEEIPNWRDLVVKNEDGHYVFKNAEIAKKFSATFNFYSYLRNHSSGYKIAETAFVSRNHFYDESRWLSNLQNKCYNLSNSLCRHCSNNY